MKTSQRKKTSVPRLSFQNIFVSKRSSLPSSSCFHHRSGSWKPWLINSRRHSIFWLELFIKVKLKSRLALYWDLKLILLFSFQRRFVTHWHWQIITRAAIIIARSSLPSPPNSYHYHDHHHHWHCQIIIRADHHDHQVGPQSYKALLIDQIWPVDRKLWPNLWLRSKFIKWPHKHRGKKSSFSVDDIIQIQDLGLNCSA